MTKEQQITERILFMLGQKDMTIATLQCQIEELQAKAEKPVEKPDPPAA